MNSDLSILFIHYHYPPVKNSGVYRNYYLSDALSKLTRKCFVITSDNSKVLPVEPLPINPDIEVFPCFTCDYRTISGRLSKAGTTKHGAQFSEHKKDSPIAQFLLRVQRSFPFNLLLAEGSILYIFNAYFTAKRLIRQHNIKVVFSSFMPYADHIIARMLKGKFPQLIWIADFRDLQVEPIYKNTLGPGFQKKVEKFLLQKADIITTVSDGISAKMKEIHSNVHTITKGVTLRPVLSSFNHFTIHYSGSLFLDYRDPRPLFRVMNKLLLDQKLDVNKVRFIYAGKDGKRMSLWAAENGLESIFVNKGMLPREVALEYQSKSHINLLLTSASEEHTGLLTGKLFEYIEAGREILCWIKGSKDQEIERMFDDYGLGSVLYKRDDLEAYIISKYREWIETGEVRSHHKRVKIMQELSWEHQAGKVLQLIENCSKS